MSVFNYKGKRRVTHGSNDERPEAAGPADSRGLLPPDGRNEIAEAKALERFGPWTTRFTIIAHRLIPGIQHAVPVWQDTLTLGRSIHGRGRVAGRGSLQFRPDAAAQVERPEEGGSAAAHLHGLLFRVGPACGCTQGSADEFQRASRGEDAGAERVLEMSPAEEAAHGLRHCIGIEWIDPGGEPKFCGVDRWAGLQGAGASRAGIQQLLPPRPMIVSARR